MATYDIRPLQMRMLKIMEVMDKTWVPSATRASFPGMTTWTW